MRFFLFVCFAILSYLSFCQIGGTTTYNFLNLPFNARSAGLGNDFITSKDHDLNLAIQNPALYNTSMDGYAGFNQALLASGINYGMLTYAKKWDEQVTAGASFRYVTYGVMEKTNEAGLSEGKFYAGDFIVGSGFAKQLNPLIAVGVNMNVIYSQMSNAASFGFSGDLAGVFEKKEKEFTATALVKNVGYQVKPYIKGERAHLPLEFQMAFAKKVKHAPFRFGILLHHLNKFDLTYNDPNAKPVVDALTGDTIDATGPGLGEKIFRHITYQTELIFSKNFHVRFGFDYHMRQELKLTQKPGLSGFSFGVGLRFKRFSLDYALVAYSSAGYSNLISLNANLKNFRR